MAQATEHIPTLQTQTKRITARSILLGAITVIALNMYTDHAGLVAGSASLVKSQYPMAMLLPFVLWLFFNTALKAFVPKYSLSGTELLVIYSMSWIAGVIPLEGWAAYLVSTITVPTYYASPENRWETILFNLLPWWTLPDTNPAVIRPFFDGLPNHMGIPWSGWYQPVFWWLIISLAVLVAGICLCIMMQKQWEENERLTYPLAQFAVELTSGFDEPGRLPSLFQNRIFWAGFWVVFGVFAWNIVGYFFTGLPRITVFGGYTSKEIILARDFPPIYHRILPSVVGLTYFCNLDILLSLWLFRLIAIFKLGTMDRIGFTVGLSGQQVKPPEIVNLESHGAMAFLALWSLWVARGHLKHVWQAAKEGAKSPLNDSVISYRTALLGFVTSTLFIIGWMHAVGMAWPVAILQTTLLFLAYLTVAKFTAASGFTHLLPPGSKGGGMVKTFAGTTSLTPGDFVGINMVNSSAFFGNDRIPAWPALPHHFKLFGQRRNPLIVHLAVWAFVIGLLTSFLYIVYLAYTHAGQNLHTAPFTGRQGSVRPYDNMVKDILADTKTVFDPAKTGIWILGGIQAALLVSLRNRLPWWPLHPLGLAFQNTSGPRIYAFSIFITWLSKSLLLALTELAKMMRLHPASWAAWNAL